MNIIKRFFCWLKCLRHDLNALGDCGKDIEFWTKEDHDYWDMVENEIETR